MGARTTVQKQDHSSETGTEAENREKVEESAVQLLLAESCQTLFEQAKDTGTENQMCTL